MISNNFLFYGPKGCGKSLFASVTFSEFSKEDPGWNTVEIKKAEIFESPLEKLRQTFSTISRYQINGILIEDIDLLLCGFSDNPAARQTLLEGIKEFGEKQVLIATTRNPNKVDDVILAEFDTIAPFYYLPEVDRRDILRVHTQVKRQVILGADVDLSDIAKRTSWFSGADIENTVVWASKNIHDNEISRNTINEAIDFIAGNISVSRRIQEMKELVDFTINHCTINAIREELLSYAKALSILSPTDQPTGTDVDLNKILELKPNFCGLGVNINEIIAAVRRKLKRKKE